MKKELVSVIIPACNEEKYITKTLESIKKQNYPHIESIVVCNGCTDKTFQVAIPNADKVLKLEEGNVSKARNFGAKVAKGSTLVFLDADTLLKEEAIQRIIETNATIGLCKAVPDKNKLIAHFFLWFKGLFWWLNWSNGLIFCKKEVFDKITGFNEELTKKEDSDFTKRAREHGKLKLAKTCVIGSMRRHENWGYIKVIGFWIKEQFFPSKEEYEVIR